MSQPKQRPPAWAFAASSIRLKPDAVISTSRIAQPIFEPQQAVADGTYEVLSFHTRGRFASVWLAKNVADGSQVAIKVRSRAVPMVDQDSQCCTPITSPVPATLLSDI